MLEVFIFLFCCTILAFLYEYSCTKRIVDSSTLKLYKNEICNAKIFFMLLALTMISYAGLRTVMNDTSTYILSFNNKIPSDLDSILQVGPLVGENPLFHIYQILIKALISESGHVFIFISSIITTGSMLLFIKKYSIRFNCTIYYFITFAVYAFSMGAMKQTMATSLAIWSIPSLLKRNFLRVGLIIAISTLIHPYVFIFSVIFFFTESFWDKKTLLIILMSLLLGSSMVTLLSISLPLLATMGDAYELSDFTGSGINIFRFLFFCIVPALSFINRKSLLNKNNKFINLSINLSIISMCFMIFGCFGGANMFGRMACYFSLFHCIVLPIILRYGEKTKPYNKILEPTLIISFAFFYYTYYSKYLTVRSDFYYHISFIELLRSW